MPKWKELHSGHDILLMEFSKPRTGETRWLQRFGKLIEGKFIRD